MKNISYLLTLLILCGATAAWAQSPPFPGSSLGVFLADVNEARAQELKLTDPRGALVGKVIENSPAEKAGLRENDVIVGFDNQTIQQATQVYMLLSETLPGSSVMLRIVRAGQEREVTVIVGDRQGTNISLPAGSQFYSSPKRVRLGVKTTALSGPLANFFGLAGKPGLLITEVEHRTLAEQAGLKAGDCLLTINGVPVSSPADLNLLVTEAATAVPGRSANQVKNELILTLVRAQKEQSVTVKLTDAEN